MGDNSKIEWTDASWNPIRARNLSTGKVGWYCEHVTTGCEHCYAEGINKRLGTGLPFKPGHRKDVEIFLDREMLTAPLRWKRPRKIFLGSMTDVFADFVTDDMLDQIFVVMMLCQHHTFQIVTKRSERMRRYLTNAEQVEAVRNRLGSGLFTVTQRVQGKVADYVRRGFGLDPAFGFGPVYSHDWERAKPYLRTLPLHNVWLLVSAENQEQADARIPDLLATPAAVRGVSLEPLLGAIDLDEVPFTFMPGYFGSALRWHHLPRCDSDTPYPKLDWVIVGGESGPHARPMHPAWARSLRDDCARYGVAFFFKQWGEWRPHANDFPRNADRAAIVFPDGTFTTRGLGDASGRGGADMYRAGKASAGRLLDGVEHSQFPTPARALHDMQQDAITRPTQKGIPDTANHNVYGGRARAGSSATEEDKP